MPLYLNQPPQGPLTRVIASVIALITLVGAVMLGLVAFLVIAGLALVAGIAIWLRVAWIKRRMEKQGVNLGAQAGEVRETGNVIDAEYTVVDDSSDSRKE